jgi:hypothetical protein
MGIEAGGCCSIWRQALGDVHVGVDFDRYLYRALLRDNNHVLRYTGSDNCRVSLLAHIEAMLEGIKQF